MTRCWSSPKTESRNPPGNGAKRDDRQAMENSNGEIERGYAVRCPFLREAQVKYCCASEFKKMIVRGQGDENAGRCFSPDYVSCPAAKQHHEDIPSRSHCPFLQESLVQYCAAASVSKYIPYSSPSLSRCGNTDHRYCELFLTMQNPAHLASHGLNGPDEKSDVSGSGAWIVDGVLTAGWLYYSGNHMWADIDKEGHCHIGLDAFFTRIMGNLERLAFVVTAGERHPAVSVTVNGTELQMIFPNRITVSSVNSHLRAEPNRVITDPYTFGWLFEGTMPKESRAARNGEGEGLFHGESVRRWMQSETKRMTEFVHNRLVATEDDGLRSMADGGMFIEQLAKHLTREEILLLNNDFFSIWPRRIS